MTPDIIIPTCKTRYEIAPLVCNLEGHSLGCRVIATSHPIMSAAQNRNEGLRHALSDIIIMIDDDVAGFYDGWWQELISPLQNHPDIVLVSARLLKSNGDPGPMMFAGDPQKPGLITVPRCPTACIAFRNEGIQFNEVFVGSGYEDDDFCAQLQRKHPFGRVVINNRVRVIHANEQKFQGENLDKNRRIFETLWTTINDNTVRVDKYWNIPKIIHFVWIGPPMPDWAIANINEFRRLNPDFEIKIHGEECLDNRFAEHYKRINHPDHSLAIKADLLRLSVLLSDGGWFWDTDFWPLVSIRDMCDRLKWNDTKNPHLRTILFSREEITANGAIGCRPYDPGLQKIVEIVLNQKMDHPAWWDYGTFCVGEALRKHPELFFDLPLSLIIPHVGKDKALACMRSIQEIQKTKDSGAWAIHFEMQTTIETGDPLCTVQNTVRTVG